MSLDLDRLEREMTDWRRDLHAHPEFGFEERRTSAFVAAKLREFDFDEVAEGIGGTGVVGTLKRGNSNRAIALRADMDALRITERGEQSYRSQTPGTMHACGHDGHTAMLLGAAKLLAEEGAFDGTVRFIFQPAEEWGKGALAMIADGLIERFPFEEIFVYPAMSDQGEAAGGALEYLFERDGLKTWLANRSTLPDVYLGRDYTAGADDVFRAGGAEAVLTTPGGDAELAQRCAQLIVEGKVVGTYLGRGEYGPRALGARSIMAAAVDRRINDWLNQRLERTEFMPFAPVVRKERCADLFDLPQSLMYTAQFMTVTCNVKPEWKDKIPAVVHVDGTARPQVVSRETNPLYYDIIKEYERMTGIPALINTSFNVHEEPIINRPQDAFKALQQGRVDYVVTQRTLWKHR